MAKLQIISLSLVDMINSIGGKAVVVYGSEAAIELYNCIPEGTIDDLEIVSDTYPKEKQRLQNG